MFITFFPNPKCIRHPHWFLPSTISKEPFCSCSFRLGHALHFSLSLSYWMASPHSQGFQCCGFTPFYPMTGLIWWQHRFFSRKRFQDHNVWMGLGWSDCAFLNIWFNLTLFGTSLDGDTGDFSVFHFNPTSHSVLLPPAEIYTWRSLRKPHL